MKHTVDDSADRTACADRPDVRFYLPGMGRLSNEPGRVERSVRRLFRRRGVLPADFLFGRYDR